MTAVKGVWAYIMLHKLHNPQCRTEIVCDDAMRVVFGDRVDFAGIMQILQKNVKSLGLEHHAAAEKDTKRQQPPGLN